MERPFQTGWRAGRFPTLPCAVFLAAAFVLGVPEAMADVCDRTEQVRDALVTATGVDSCDLVTDAKLATITVLDLNDKGISAFKRGDFEGLDSLIKLKIEGNNLTAASFPKNFLNRELPLSIDSIEPDRNPGCPLRASLGGPCFAPPLSLVAGHGKPGDDTGRTGEIINVRADTDRAWNHPLSLSVGHEWEQTGGPDATFSQVGAALSVVVPFVSESTTATFKVTQETTSSGRWATLILARFWETHSRTIELTFEPPAPTSDTSLKVLEVDHLAPVHDAETGGLRVWLPNDTTRARVVATPTDRLAEAAITPADSASGTPGHQVALSPGDNTITVQVTASDEMATETYTFIATRSVTAEGVCDRTSEVADKLVALTTASACEGVTNTMLAQITSLDLSDSGLTTLKSNDLAGLSSLANLNLKDNSLSVESYPPGLLNTAPIGVIETISVSGNPGCASHGNDCYAPSPTILVNGSASANRSVATREAVTLKVDLGSYHDPLSRGTDATWEQVSGPTIDWTGDYSTFTPMETYFPPTGYEQTFIVPEVSEPTSAVIKATLETGTRRPGKGNANWSRPILNNFWETKEVTIELTFLPVAPPMNLTVEPSHYHARLKWNAPAPDAAIRGFEYRHKSDGDYGAWQTILNSFPGGENEDGYRVEDLTNNTTYSFQLRAENALGTSRVSNEATATTPYIEPLRASLVEVVEEPEDSGRWHTFDMMLSEPIRKPVAQMREHVFTVTNGTIVKAKRYRRLRRGGNSRPYARHWRMRVSPTDATADVTVSVQADRRCGEPSALCTPDGGRLETAASITLGSVGSDHPVISIADTTAREGGYLNFPVTASFPSHRHYIVYDFEILDTGTATVGTDYGDRLKSADRFEKGRVAATSFVLTRDDPIDDGGETVNVRISNARLEDDDGNVVQTLEIAQATATGTILNDDPMPRAWLARFGRTVAEQVIDAVEGRLDAARTPGLEASLAGQALPSWRREDGEDRAADASAAPRRKAGEQAGVAALSDRLHSEDNPDRPRLGSRPVAPRELLTGSAFALTIGADGTGGDVATLWGRGAFARFDGREGDLSLSGEVTTAMLGADWAREVWMAGLLLSHARGEGSYRSASGGKVTSTVTGLYPYGRYALNDRVTVWGTAGYGAGTLTLKPDGDAPIETDMDLMMAAAGLRGTVVQAPPEGGPELAVKTDAMAVRTSSDAVSDGPGGNLAAATADVTRLRLGLEGSWRGTRLGTGTIEPRLEIGIRHDGGDAETGFGLDLGGGLAWADPESGIRAEVSGRGLLTHESAGFRQRGIAGRLGWDPRSDSKRGPSVTVSQSMGRASAGGVDALFRQRTLEGLAANDDGDEFERRQLELKLGYGFGVFGDGFTWTPELGFGMSEGHREYSFGWRLVRDRKSGDLRSLELPVEGRRVESANENVKPKHRIGLRLTARF